jgi:hypothetical protein
VSKRTHEQQRAFAELRAIAEPHRLRVRADGEGFPVVPGRYGQVEWTGGPELAVYCDRPRLFRRLSAIPGVRPRQIGDTEMRSLFPPEAIEPVAALIQARRRRIGRPLSPEAARRLREARLGATSAVQEPRPPVGMSSEKGAGRPPALPVRRCVELLPDEARPVSQEWGQ